MNFPGRSTVNQGVNNSTGFPNMNDVPPYSFNPAPFVNMLSTINHKAYEPDPDAPPPSYEMVMAEYQQPTVPTTNPIPIGFVFPVTNNDNTNQLSLPVSTPQISDLLRSNPRRNLQTDLIPATPIVQYNNPTLKPIPNFDPQEDSYTLSKQIITNNLTLLFNVLCRRSLQQRLLIDKELQKIHIPLIEIIKTSLKNNYKKLMIALMMPCDLLDVQYLHIALNKYNHAVVADIICVKSNEEIKHLKLLYKQTFGEPLENLITAKTGVNFRQLMLRLLNANRNETITNDIYQLRREAKIDAEKLKNPKYDSDSINLTFLHIFTNRSFQQIQLIGEEYEKLYQKTLYQRIKSEFTAGDKQGYLVIAGFARSNKNFYAIRLRKSMKSFTMNTAQLIRIIVTRCEIDLKDIKDMCGDLNKWITDNTYGNFRLGLLALIGDY